MMKYENDSEKYLLPLEICTVSNSNRFFCFLSGFAFTLPLIFLITRGNPKENMDDTVFLSILALLGVAIMVFFLVSGKAFLTIDTEKIHFKSRIKEQIFYWSDMNNLDLDIYDDYNRRSLISFYVTTNYILRYSERSGKPVTVSFSLHRRKFDKQMMENTIWYLYNRYK